jgi:hypothetical protein
MCRQLNNKGELLSFFQSTQIIVIHDLKCVVFLFCTSHCWRWFVLKIVFWPVYRWLVTVSVLSPISAQHRNGWTMTIQLKLQQLATSATSALWSEKKMLWMKIDTLWHPSFFLLLRISLKKNCIWQTQSFSTANLRIHFFCYRQWFGTTRTHNSFETEQSLFYVLIGFPTWDSGVGS